MFTTGIDRIGEKGEQELRDQLRGGFVNLGRD